VAPSVDFVVHEHTAQDALRAARAILTGRGFRVVGTAPDRALATRGNRVLTAALGALVPFDRHYQRLSLETLPIDTSTVALRLRALHGGAAVAAGVVQQSRTAAVFRDAADRIASTLSAGGHMLRRWDRL
jgi:hypothetical protein